MSRELLNKNECTVLKGIAILTVILSHICGVCHLFDGIPVIGNEQICSALGEAGMPLFLFVSGYGLHISFQRHGMQGYWKKRFISVLIPYMAVQAVTMFIYFIIHGTDSFSLISQPNIICSNLRCNIIVIQSNIIQRAFIGFKERFNSNYFFY